MLGIILLCIAGIAILHAAFSTYEHLSLLKALGKPEGSIPLDIILEAIGGLVLGTIGVTIWTPELREISWRSEMKKRPLEDIDPKMAFATFARRADLLPEADEKTKS